MANKKGKNNSSGARPQRQSYSEKYGSNRPNPYTGYLPPGSDSGKKMYHPEAIDTAKLSRFAEANAYIAAEAAEREEIVKKAAELAAAKREERERMEAEFLAEQQLLAEQQIAAVRAEHEQLKAELEEARRLLAEQKAAIDSNDANDDGEEPEERPVSSFSGIIEQERAAAMSNSTRQRSKNYSSARKKNRKRTSSANATAHKVTPERMREIQEASAAEAVTEVLLDSISAAAKAQSDPNTQSESKPQIEAEQKWESTAESLSVAGVVLSSQIIDEAGATQPVEEVPIEGAPVEEKPSGSENEDVLPISAAELSIEQQQEQIEEAIEDMIEDITEDIAESEASQSGADADSPIEELSEEIIEAPVEELSEEIIEAPIEELSKEIGEAPVEEKYEETTDAPVEELSEEIIEEPTELPAEEKTESLAEESGEQITEEIRQTADENTSEKPEEDKETDAQHEEAKQTEPEEFGEEASVQPDGDDDVKVAMPKKRAAIRHVASIMYEQPPETMDEEHYSDQDGSLFLRKEKTGVQTAVFDMPEGVHLPGYTDDDEFLNQWLSEGEDEMIIKDKRRRRRVSTVLGTVTILLALVGFGVVINFIVGSLSGMGNPTGKNSEYEKFIAPVVLSDPEPFETWEGADKQKLLECSILAITTAEGVNYTIDDTNRIVIPSADVSGSARRLFGPLVELDLSALNEIEGGDLYFYSETDDCFHVAITGISETQPVIIGSPKKEGNTITLVVGYLSQSALMDESTDEDSQYYKTMVYVLNQLDSGYYISALREYVEQ